MVREVRMSEARWRRCRDLGPMWEYVEGRVSPRKLRLFTAACLRRVGSVINQGFRDGVEALERYADGEVNERTWRKVRAACQTAFEQADTASDYREDLCVAEGVFRAACGEYAAALHQAARAHAFTVIPIYLIETAERHWNKTYAAERAAQCGLLREVVGNPFRPVTLDPAWRTSTVVAIARQVYESRDFSAMPILADALEDAGCQDRGVLAHCREAGEHARGCWVADLLLGKT
jgi:hypothetical protein